MRPDKLVRMANQIGAFWASEPDPRAASEAVANHLRRFWEPRMRRALVAHLDSGGEGLDPLVLEAVAANRARLLSLTPRNEVVGQG